jgi:signal transduction histidine kinase/HAMP domain-containing protein
VKACHVPRENQHSLARLSPHLFAMRWWLAATFAGVAGLTAVAVVAILTTRSEHAFRNYSSELAVGNTVMAIQVLRERHTPAGLRAAMPGVVASRHLALFVFDARGRLLTQSTSYGTAWSDVPGGMRVVRTVLAGKRYLQEQEGAYGFVLGFRFLHGGGAVLVTYSLQPELRQQFGVVRNDFLHAGLVAFALGATTGLLIATLIALRLGRIARAASAIGEGDFEPSPVRSRFPDEVGVLAASIEQMRRRLSELFHTLESDRQRLKELLDRLDEGVLLVDSELNIEFANNRARELLGVDGHDEDLNLAHGTADSLRRLIEDLFSLRMPNQLRISIDGRSLLVSGIPSIPGGNTAIVVVVDESQRERNEQAQREFATNAAHELRAPLTSIVTAIEMLQTGAKEDPAARDQFLEIVEREADRLTRLTRALLVLARAQARQEVPPSSSIPVASLLDRVAASLPRREGVEIRIDCSRDVTMVGDSDLFEQAISSIASNALEHTEEGSVTMRVRVDGAGQIVIEVIDSGNGIAERERGRVFDRFHRVGERGGFGLGLSIAREAVHSLGGEIELESEVSVGTTVRITIPRSTGEPA